MKKITVVFPMAGEGQRFGNKFKPFLKIFNKTFIELAIEPFLKHKDQIEKFIFIIQEKHLTEFHVGYSIEKIMPIDTIWHIVGVTQTKNVVETINCVLPLDNVIFCDCDHSLNVDDIFESINEDVYDCIIPGWVDDYIDEKKWSIACVDDNGMVLDIAEKKHPLVSGDCDSYGVIGCYYFNHLPEINFKADYISDLVKLQNRVKLIPITEAEFFGDPERLKNLYISKNANTIFCDLDGTIIKHENIPDYTKGIELLDGAKEKIDEWRKQNSFIVLTTSRDEQFRLDMEKMLREAGIKYEYLIMGLPPGARYLINDKKPYSDKEMASAIEVERDLGIKDINIGHSAAKFRVKDGVAYKNISMASEVQDVNKFHNQIRSMMSLEPRLIPNILSYGMKFLDYKSLDKLSLNDRADALDVLFNELSILYNESEHVSAWLSIFMRNKINSKAEKLHELGVSNEVLELTNSVFYAIDDLESNRIGFFHGDLTYENILYKNGQIKFIDTDNDFQYGAFELDLGKLMQSILTGYEKWPEEHEVNKAEFYLVLDFYRRVLNEPIAVVKKKAYFYCVLHLIRMMSYQAKVSMERVKIAEKYCLKFLNILKDGSY